MLAFLKRWSISLQNNNEQYQFLGILAILLSRLLDLNFMFLFQGIFLSIWTVGFKKTFTELVPRFPGLFLFPIFGLFTFGPKSKQNCQCSSYGNNEMQVSFPHTYVNLLLWVLGFFGVALYLDPYHYSYLSTWIIILVPAFVGFLLLLLFYMFEKKCCISCCSSCCLPFTERSVFAENSNQKDIEQQQQQQSEGDFEMMQIA